MIPFKRKTSLLKAPPGKISKEPYLIINLILAGAILLILVYSVIFSPSAGDYPVTCMHERITGSPCFSCGLSHSFSLIMKGHLKEANEWNSQGLRIFLFFTGQLMMRLGFSSLYLSVPGTRSQLIIFDITGSSALFLLAFWPFLKSIIVSASLFNVIQ